MTFNAVVPRYTPRKSQSRSSILLPIKSRKLLPVKSLPGRFFSRPKFSPKCFLAMAVSIISSISFLWVLFLVIVSG